MGDVLQLIADVASELADPRQHTERVRTGWTAARNPVFTAHTTIQPGLLAQLYESVIPGSAEQEGARSTPGSRPPLALEALSRHSAIVIAVTRWCWTLRLELRDTVEGNLRALVGAAAQLDDDTARTLLSEMRAWRRWCAVMTGWESPLFAPRAPCPVCETLGTLRVNLSAASAFCTACGSGWDREDGGIEVLARHIRAVTDRSAA